VPDYSSLTLAFRQVDLSAGSHKGKRRAGDECPLTPFFKLQLVHYFAVWVRPPFRVKTSRA
jgi:hypothetical protein